MNLSERRQYLISRLNTAKAKAYDIKLQTEALKTQAEATDQEIMALLGALDTIQDMEAVEARKVELPKEE